MSFLDKLRKKRDPFDDITNQEATQVSSHDPLGLKRDRLGLSEPSFGDQPALELEPLPAQSNHRMQSSQNISFEKDLELISSKLETIKVILSSMEQRLANLEQAAAIQQKQRLW